MNVSPDSYEEYRQKVEAQRQRDLDRFTGEDSHPEQPVYDARDGSPVVDTLDFSLTLDVLIDGFRKFNDALEAIALGIAAVYNVAVEDVLPVQEGDYSILFGDSSNHIMLGVLDANGKDIKWKRK